MTVILYFFFVLILDIYLVSFYLLFWILFLVGILILITHKFTLLSIIVLKLIYIYLTLYIKND